MSKFITCSVFDIQYRDKKATNDPVNIDNCNSLSKGKLAFYPDNVGKPTIIFQGCDCSWTFNSELERDSELQKILEHN